MFSRITPLGVVMGSLLGLYVFIFLSRITTTLTHRHNKYTILINLVNLIPAGIIAYLCFTFSSKYLIYTGYLVFFGLVIDLIYLVIRLIFKKKELIILKKIYMLGIIPLSLAFCFILYGHINMANVIETNYTFETNKISNSYKICLISDTHYGTIQEKALLDEKINYINTLNIDFLILCGDIVEEKTSKDDMKEIFSKLGSVKTKYGVYYNYGNHDRQPYDDRTFSDNELANAIKLSGIRILQDESIDIGDEIVLIGREDYSKKNRKGIKELLDGVDTKKYIIVSDHQPEDTKNNSENGVDLQVSGHTHARQIWPIGLFYTMMGAYNYGNYQINNMNLVVSSGFTGWGYPIRTEKHCEYVIININGNK